MVDEKLSLPEQFEVKGRFEEFGSITGRPFPFGRASIESLARFARGLFRFWIMLKLVGIGLPPVGLSRLGRLQLKALLASLAGFSVSGSCSSWSGLASLRSAFPVGEGFN